MNNYQPVKLLYKQVRCSQEAKKLLAILAAYMDIPESKIVTRLIRDEYARVFTLPQKPGDPLYQPAPIEQE